MINAVLALLGVRGIEFSEIFLGIFVSENFRTHAFVRSLTTKCSFLWTHISPSKMHCASGVRLFEMKQHGGTPLPQATDIEGKGKIP